MSTVTVTVDWSRPVWKCAGDDESRRMLQAAHIERGEDASHVRVTCSQGFSLASVVYPAEVPADFTFADVPAELLQYMADAAQTSDSPGCENCEGEWVVHPNWTLTLDTEQKVAEVKTGLMSCRMAFIEPVGTGFPDWRELLRKVLKEWKPERPTPSLALDPELLAKASKAIGTDYIARMCIPASPRDGVVLIGSDGCFAVVMPMFTEGDAPDRVAKIAALVAEKASS